MKVKNHVIVAAAFLLGAQTVGGTVGASQGGEAMDKIAASGKGFTLTGYQNELAKINAETPKILDPVLIAGIIPYSVALVTAPLRQPSDPS